MWSDAGYGSGRNVWEAERRGTEMVSPVRGRKVKEAVGGDGPVMLTAADFDIDAAAIGSAACPAGHRAVAAHQREDAPERVELVFSRMDCGPCALRTRCPVTYRRRPEAPRARGGVYVLNADLIRVNIERRRKGRVRQGMAQAVWGSGRDRGDELGDETGTRAWTATGAWRREG